MLGMSCHLRLLMVCHAYREGGRTTVIRIISARTATANERQHYRKERP
jgi:uncharacterized DUF497 family protein